MVLKSLRTLSRTMLKFPFVTWTSDACQIAKYM